MLYQTIVLELLEARPGLHTYLRRSRKLLAEMERYAADLRAAHLDRMNQGFDSSSALELALAELEARLDQEATRHASPDEP
ncbi:unnamed protein product [Gemmata massiliana]|uniref:Uncharacterized protein n=1 Tax=Gemmata massiliana TaxID=1210884 RepID=A0A6P2CSM9_9BACT|nr:hypothetical protein [Gemmata massiliana]VTR91617.1 unnamed protein product [Gemmata massiliana]